MSKITIKEPRVADLQKSLGEEIAKGDEANQEKLQELMNDAAKVKEELAALNESKMVFEENERNSSQFTDKDYRNAFLLGQRLESRDPFDTKLGQRMSKAVTSVGRFTEGAKRDIERELQEKLVVSPIFRNVNVEGKTLDIPVSDEDTDLTVRQTANGQYPVSSTDTANTVPGVQNTISSVMLAPHTFQSKTWLARAEEEDTLLPLLDFLIDGATNRIQRAFEKGLIRGDGSITTSSNTPSDYASVINGFVNRAESVAGDGLKVFTGANATQASAVNIATARAVMGKYGMVDPSQLVYITTIEGINELIQTADFRTVDTFGPKATYHTGVLGAVWGIPVITSEFLDVKGASTTSNQAVGVLVYKPGFVVGNKRPLIIETEYRPDTQVTDIHISMRADMKALTTVASSALSNSYSFATVIHTGDSTI